MTFSITTFSITTVSITTVSIAIKNRDTQPNNIHHNGTQYCYVECHMLSVIYADRRK
jgi:hypothetical protein